MKKSIWILVMAFLCITAVMTVPQTVMAEEAGNVIDHAELLTDAEEYSLSQDMREISERRQCELVIVTLNSEELGGKSLMAYADDYFDYNGYGLGADRSGILLLVSMTGDGHGDYWISTSGYGITAFTDAGIDYIGQSFVPYLKEQKYAKAFQDFADNCDAFIEEARKGEPYDINHMPKGDFPWLKYILIALGVGIVIAFLVVTSMKAKLRTVRPAKSAANYVKDGSMHVTERSDIFLFRNVSRRIKPKQNSGGGGGSSTHHSSSGRSHGGGGGHF